MQTIFAGESGNVGIFLLLPIQGESEDSAPDRGRGSIPCGKGRGRERMQMGEACPGGLSCSPSCLWESPHKGSSLSFFALRGRGHRRGLCLPSGQGIKVTLPSLFQSVNSIASGRAQFSPEGLPGREEGGV